VVAAQVYGVLFYKLARVSITTGGLFSLVFPRNLILFKSVTPYSFQLATGASAYWIPYRFNKE
jgi:hypothetical protein